jgi:hypothetical protein
VTALFEPGLGTLEALERQFAQRLTKRLRAITRGSSEQLFDAPDEDSDKSLLALAARVLELRSTLSAEETKIARVAKAYSMQYLRSTHGAKTAEPVQSPKQLAEALLAAIGETDA